MQQSVDNAGWATFGTVVGLFTAAQQATQFAMAMVTLITGMVVAHFLKRALNYYFPPKKRADKQEDD